MLMRCVLLFALLFLVWSCKIINLESSTYDEKVNSATEGIVYSLPKNLLKIEIVYTVKEQYQKINGVEIKLPVNAKVYISKPIKVSSILVADESKQYILSGDRISNDFLIKSKLDFNLTSKGILKSIDADVEDQSIEFGESLVMSTANIAKTFGSPISAIAPYIDESLLIKPNSFYDTDDVVNLGNVPYDQVLYEQIKVLNAEIIKATKKEDVALYKSKVEHLEKQINDYQQKNKVFYRETDVKFVQILDPFDDKGQEPNSNEDEGAESISKTKFIHKFRPVHLFKGNSLDLVMEDENSLVIPEVSLEINISVEKSNFLNGDITSSHIEEYQGIVVRHPASSKIDLLVDGNLQANEIVFLGQLGNTSVIPVKVKRGGKKITAIKFDPLTGAIAQHKIEAVGASDKVGKSLVKSSKALQETIDYLKYEKQIKELETEKKELALSNDIYDLNNVDLDRELAELTTQEKIQVLKNKIDELNKPEEENSEFDILLKNLEQKERILQLELKIKKLQDDINASND